MSEEKNRKRNLSQGDDLGSRKRQSICQEDESNSESSNMIAVDPGSDEKGQSKMSTEDEVQEVKEKNDSVTRVADMEDKNDLESHYSCKMSCDVVTDESEPQYTAISKEQTLCSSKSKKGHKALPSVSDSVFNDGSTLRSVSESDMNESDDDPLDEYETQYLGFTPKSFMNGVYNALAEYSRESLAAFTQYIDKKYPNEMTASKLQEGKENMMKYILKKLNRSIDILEQYLMTNVFTIPDHVILPEDQVQVESQYTKEDEEQLDSEIKQLEDKILTIRYANGVLRQDLGKMDEVQTLFQKSVEQMEALEKMTQDSGVTDIKNDTIEAISKVTRMIDLVQNLEKMEMKTSL